VATAERSAKHGQQYQQQEPTWQAQQYDPTQHAQRIGAASPQQAPWQPYPPQQPPYGYQPPQYPPQAALQQPPWQGQPPQQMPPHRKRHLGRKIVGGIFGIIGVIIVISVATNSGGHTVNTAGTAATGTNAGAAKTGGNSAAAAAPKTAGIGSSITLAGDDNGEQMSVTVTKVITAASPGDEFSGAPAGDRLYAVQFRLRDTGSAAYSDAPDNSAAVVDSAGQSYQAAIDNAAVCQSFPGTENIAPGSSGLGCVVFEVPKSAKIVSAQFTLDSGFGPQTGQWDVKG
jgi:hypothetical protein